VWIEKEKMHIYSARTDAETKTRVFGRSSNKCVLLPSFRSITLMGSHLLSERSLRAKRDESAGGDKRIL